jgi:hypothetical protein
VDGLDTNEDGTVVARRGTLVQVQGPAGNTAWYRECELQHADFDTTASSPAYVKNGVLGVLVERKFIPLKPTFRVDLLGAGFHSLSIVGKI